MKAGKALEQFVVAIQEHIKNSPDTHIESNVKLIDNAGMEREIDVLVQTKVQGGIIRLAFECKDYQEKVDVSKVDQFDSVSKNIPSIHKRIMVSSKGFTDGAYKKAKFCGIELHQLGAVPFDEILNPCNIFYTQFWVELDRYYCRLIVEDDNSPALYSDNGVFYCVTDKKVDMLAYLVLILRSHMPSMLPTIHNYLHFQAKKQGNIPLTITPPNKMYVLDIDGNKHVVKEIQIAVRVTLSEQPQEIAKQSLYSGTTEETPTIRISEYLREDGINLLLVHGENNTYSAFLRDAEGNLKETRLVSVRKPTMI